jgi:hypothetical protein
MHSKVSEFCTKLTTLTPEIVSAGQSFQSVLESLRTLYNSRERVWASYGDYDRRQFEKNCALYDGLPYPFGSRHLNIKTLVAMCKGWDEEIGMEQALGKMGQMIQKEIEDFFREGRETGYYPQRKPSHFSEVVRDELSKWTSKKALEILSSPEWEAQYDSAMNTNGPSEQIKKLLIENADVILAQMMGNAFQSVLQQAREQMRR